MATVTVAFQGVPDGECYPREFAPGDEVMGDLAVVAVREGWAANGQKAAKATESKARKSAPENK